MEKTMILTFNQKLRIAEHFTAGEFKCFDETSIFIDKELVKILEQVRRHFNRPVRVTSGYRTKAHNLRVGGEPDSMHLLGIAADIKVDKVKPTEIYEYLDNQYPYTLGLGIYDSWVHVDTRFTKARWEG